MKSDNEAPFIIDRKNFRHFTSKEEANFLRCSRHRFLLAFFTCHLVDFMIFSISPRTFLGSILSVTMAFVTMLLHLGFVTGTNFESDLVVSIFFQHSIASIGFVLSLQLRVLVSFFVCTICCHCCCCCTPRHPPGTLHF